MAAGRLRPVPAEPAARDREEIMAITATRNPTTLAAHHFVGHAVVIDPADGTEQLAFTEYHVDIPSLPARTVDGDKALADTFRIKITPRAKVKIGTTLTPTLLAHEQFHYDVGFVIARRVSVLLTDLRADTVGELEEKFNKIMKLHFKTRSGLIQRRYDLDTHHGTQAHYQKVWLDRMKACLAKADSTKIGGYFL
jgi:hypothetical protein